MGQVVMFQGEEAPEGAVTFADFWTLYPRRVAKKAAAQAWARTNPRRRAAILTALASWRMVWDQTGHREEQYVHVPHPATWLNGERWEDELPPGNWKPKLPAAGSAQPRPAEPASPRAEMPEWVREEIARLRLRSGS